MFDVLDYENQRNLWSNFKIVKVIGVPAKAHPLKEPNDARSTMYEIELSASLVTDYIGSA